MTTHKPDAGIHGAASFQKHDKTFEIGIGVGMRMIDECRTPACAARWITTGNDALQTAGSLTTIREINLREPQTWIFAQGYSIATALAPGHSNC